MDRPFRTQLAQKKAPLITIKPEAPMQIVNGVPWEVRATVVNWRAEETQRGVADLRDVQRLDHSTPNRLISNGTTIPATVINATMVKIAAMMLVIRGSTY